MPRPKQPFASRLACAIATTAALTTVASAGPADADYCSRRVPPTYEPHVAISKRSPVYPNAELNRSGEGWVQFRVNVSAEGMPSVIGIDDAVGGERFIKISRDALAAWRFNPAKHAGRPVTAYGLTFVFEFRFEEEKVAYKELVVDRYRRARKYLLANDPKSAIAQLDFALRFPMTTYERSMASLLLAVAYYQQKDVDTALMHIRHALFRDGGYLEDAVVSEALALSVYLESERGNYKGALCSFEVLRERDPDKAAERQTAERVAELIGLINAPEPMLIEGRVMPAPAEGAVAVWKHPLLRERFAFAKLPPEPLKFDVTCPLVVFEGPAVKDKLVSLPPGAGSCELRVTGPVGAEFEIAEIR